jgi:hypothetical protein
MDVLSMETTQITIMAWTFAAKDASRQAKKKHIIINLILDKFFNQLSGDLRSGYSIGQASASLYNQQPRMQGAFFTSFY